MSNKLLLENKKIIITGGTAGIGKAIAIAFAKHGGDIAIFGTNEKRAADVLQELENVKIAPKQKFISELVDISDTELVSKAIANVYEVFENVDVLVNNAGITKDNFLMKMTEEDWDRVINVNLKSAYNTCKPVIRNMMKKRYGKIINISSVVGLMGNSFQTNYAASKAGLIGFTKSLAKEVAKKNINVNCIAPGFIKTQMTDVLPEKVKEEYIANIPLNRLGDTIDIANAALFLASNMSDYITGQTITVDGGMVM